MRRTHVEIRGAATHNLKGVDVDLPLEKITVVTGVSGSGKSSLAVDTLYAEGQRRFIESLSAYARQFLDRMERPEFERIDFIPPAIAIGQTSKPTSARANVGSMTQLSDLLQLLWGAASEPWCPHGHGPIRAAAPSAIRSRLIEAHQGQRLVIVAPVRRDRRSIRDLLRDGHTRALDDGGALVPVESLAGSREPEVRVVIDRLVIRDEPRLPEAIAAAFRLSGGRAELRLENGEQLTVREALACETCGFEAPPREARLFNSASPLGACSGCEGFGRVQVIDRERVVPDTRKSLLEDAIAPWSTPGQAEWKDGYQRLSKTYGLDLKKPWQDLSEQHRTLIFDGDEKTGFPGVRGFFAHLESKRYKIGSRILIARYRGFDPCPECEGSRLKKAALAYRLGGFDIAGIHRLPVSELSSWLASLEVAEAVAPLVERLIRRVTLLEEIGLGYLTLAREGRTLSSGEARRVHLSSALGAGVTGTLYVLDEPSIGLHPRDTARLSRLLHALAGSGNTVVVVEHDAEIISAADFVVELGPGAGKRGGALIFTGTPQALARLDTPTARALRAEDSGVELPRFAPLEREKLRVRGARARSLKSIDLELPLGALTCITGVSGSGKSTLLHEVLARNLPKAISGAKLDPAAVGELQGAHLLSGVHVVDTSPLARSVRSIPATYLDVWTAIRAVLCQSPDARRLGLDAAAFSFNSSGGRCEACQGLGTTTVDMQFLADVTVVCEQCGGKRFAERVLAARWHGKTVAEILSLTIDEAWDVFAEHKTVRKRLTPLLEVGLGYLELGQATATLSGGEAQRLKLAAHLAAKEQGHPVLLLDEPTTGLHHADVQKLLGAFSALLSRGVTLIVVEHNLEVIRHAHHVVDLGPEGGEAGGRLLVQGSIFDLLEHPASHTGAALAALLGPDRAPRRGSAPAGPAAEAQSGHGRANHGA